MGHVLDGDSMACRWGAQKLVEVIDGSSSILMPLLPFLLTYRPLSHAVAVVFSAPEQPVSAHLAPAASANHGCLKKDCWCMCWCWCWYMCWCMCWCMC
jgi:hypothetical protein